MKLSATQPQPFRNPEGLFCDDFFLHRRSRAVYDRPMPSPWPRSTPQDTASPQQIETLLARVERLAQMLEKRIGQTDIRVIEAEERIKRHIDLAFAPGRHFPHRRGGCAG